MLMLLDILKALLEVAGLALLGQGLLFLLAGAKRQGNVVYQAFATVTRPVIRFTRFITPRVVLDRHLGLVAFLFVAMAWFFVLVEKPGRLPLRRNGLVLRAGREAVGVHAGGARAAELRGARGGVREALQGGPGGVVRGAAAQRFRAGRA
jgi:hypothetical protein